MQKVLLPIFLVGPMGAGKTTIGRRLARVLRCTFLDSDQEIERRVGASIPLVFELEGEAGFRSREKIMIAELSQYKNIVLATGGGAVLDKGNRCCLAGRGHVIYLFASVDEQLRRVRHDNNRPLLQTDDPRARLELLLAERDPLYRQVADQVISTEGHSLGQITRAILQGLEEN